MLVLDADLLGDDLSARMERTTRIGDMLGYQCILQLPEELLLVKRQDLNSEYSKQVRAALHQSVEKLTGGKLSAEFKARRQSMPVADSAWRSVESCLKACAPIASRREECSATRRGEAGNSCLRAPVQQRSGGLAETCFSSAWHQTSGSSRLNLRKLHRG
ncbi:hypothetical protein ACLESO_29680 [Pyxidicoccus sp. 3LG]